MTRLTIACWLFAALALLACEQAGQTQSPRTDSTVQNTPTDTPVPEQSPAAAPTIAAPPAQPLSPTPLPLTTVASASATNWRGIPVSAENRCSPYDSDDYSYSQSVEARIVRDMGGIIYGPYTGRRFSNTRETDIEHIVARSEAHDSGLCAADSQTRKRFASDLLNLTLAAPNVNRYQKVAKDAAEWLPDLNQCWFAGRVIEVRRKYGLTIDRREANALDSVLSRCASMEMVVAAAPMASPTPVAGSGSSGNALELWDDNGNGRITCAEARKHGIAPVHRDHPAYQYMNDGDGDGVVCE